MRTTIPSCCCVILFVLFLSFGTGYCLSIPEPSGLEPPRYDVGFKTLERYDHTRTFGSSLDYFGNPIAADITRPMQICVWYPAVAQTDASRLVFGEYTFPYPNDALMFQFLSQLQEREVNRLRQVVGGDQGWVLDLLSVEVAGIGNAEPAPGQFPLLVYAGRAGRGIEENYRMFEYLAGQGYVVAAIHSVGSQTLNPAVGSTDLETITRDLEFGTAVASELPFVDPNRLVFCGSGLGAQAALLASMRNGRTRGLIMLAPVSSSGVAADRLTAHPGFDSYYLDSPVLCLTPDSSGGPGTEILNSLPYAEREVIECQDAELASFSSYDLIHLLATDSTAFEESPLPRAYGSLCRLVARFLENTVAATVPDPPPDLVAADNPDWRFITHIPAESRPPTPQQFLSILMTRGLPAARELCETFRLMQPDNPILPQATLNAIGYQFIQTGNPNAGHEVLKWATLAYPGSANAWDSFADACLATGDSTTALQMLKKSMEVLANDTITPGATREYLREHTPGRIAELEARLSSEGTTN